MTKGPINLITIDTHVRCLQVVPAAEDRQVPADLKTVGFRLTREEAVHLARILLAATQEWDELEVVAYRHEKRPSDGSYRLSVLPKHHGFPVPEVQAKIKHDAPKGLDAPADMTEHLESLKDQPISD